MEPVDALFQLGVIAAVVAKVTERVRVRFPKLDGDLVTLFTTAAGTGIAWAYGLDASSSLMGQTVVDPFNWIISGLFIAGGAGLIADVTGSSSRVTVSREIRTGAVTETVSVTAKAEPADAAPVGADGLPADIGRHEAPTGEPI